MAHLTISEWRLALVASLLGGPLAACESMRLEPAQNTLAPSAGSTAVSTVDNMHLVRVEGGPFTMGSDTGLTDEGPAHEVELSPFWIDKTEVTNSMYSSCVDAEGCQPPVGSTYFENVTYSAHPVVFVSWRDAAAYCSWADRRLPTEAEWEKAATWDIPTGEKRAYPWGNDFDCARGNFDDEIELDSFVMPGGPNCDGHARSAPVGSYLSGASPSGALDMAGNVWEWVHDAFLETDPFSSTNFNYYSVSPVSNPQGVNPSTTPYRIVRGGSWNVDFGDARSTYRLWFGMDEAYDGIGFRCARSE